MTTVGGAISGYWAMGSTCDAIRPAIVMMIEMTPAKIGRPMKNSENDMTRTRYFGGAAGAAGAAADAAAGASVTGAPGRTFSKLSVITRSPAFSPDRIVQSAPTQSPVRTGIGCALPSASTTKTSADFSVCTTAGCGTR